MSLFFIILFLFLVSFILALKSLSETEVPPEVKKAIQSLKRKEKINGVFIFLKEKVIHFIQKED